MEPAVESTDCVITMTLLPEAAEANDLASMGKRKSGSLDSSTENIPPTEDKKKKQPREVVDSLQLSMLVSSYNVHFAKYSEGKTKVMQVIPNAVWKLVYVDYKKVFPTSVFKEVNLKERVRETLMELKTGNSNEKRSEQAALQSPTVLEELKLTDGHAKRNILSHRAKLIDGTPPTKVAAAKTATSASAGGTCDSGSQSSDVTAKKSEHALLSEQVDVIASISVTLQSSASTKEKIAAAKLTQVSTKEKLAAAKLNELKLRHLQTSFDIGAISQDEFCLGARGLLDDQSSA